MTRDTCISARVCPQRRMPSSTALNPVSSFSTISCRPPTVSWSTYSPNYRTIATFRSCTSARTSSTETRIIAPSVLIVLYTASKESQGRTAGRRFSASVVRRRLASRSRSIPTRDLPAVRVYIVRSTSPDARSPAPAHRHFAQRRHGERLYKAIDKRG